MKSLGSLFANPASWHQVSLLMMALTMVFPHATLLAVTAKAIGLAASQGNVAGAVSALVTGGVGLGLHIYQHGKAQADSNAKPQTAAPPN